MANRDYKPRTYALGQQLVTLRNRTGLTQTDLGQLIGVSRRSILKWEGGEGIPNGPHLLRLLTVLAERNAFTVSQELAEAEALWDAVSQAATKRLGQFNRHWFGQLMTNQHGRQSAPPPEPVGPTAPPLRAAGADVGAQPTPAAAPTMIDWGEAIDVPPLYGRTSQLTQLQQWVVVERCRVVTVLGLGGMGKTSLALTFAQQALPHFDLVLFRSLHNGPPLAEVLDQIIRAVSDQPAPLPEPVGDKVALLIQLFRARRCLLVLDNFESIMQPGALSGTYRTGYAEYATLLQGLSQRQHQSCLLLTSREKPPALGPLAGHRAGPVRTLALTGLDDAACRIIPESQDIYGTQAEIAALARLYGGNPLALQLSANPLRELFGHDIGAFLAAGNAFFNGVGALLQTQFARSTPLEQSILRWLVVERELVPLSTLLDDIGDSVPQREVLAALESLRDRMLIERGPGSPTFTLQPVILEYLGEQLVEAIMQELIEERPQLLQSHALVQATAKEYVRRSQELLLATPVLERMAGAFPEQQLLERQLLTVLAAWRAQPPLAQGYGPGNLINFLRLLRGHLRGLDFSGLALRQVYLQGVEAQDTSLARTSLRDIRFTEAFGSIQAVAISLDGAYWAAASNDGMLRVWRNAGRTAHLTIQAHGKEITTLAFSPDGQTLASGSYDCTIRLWSMRDGGLLRALEGHRDYVQSIAFAPDGRTLVSGSDDWTIRLWAVDSGACLQTWSQHTDNVYGVTWSPDGQLVASCSFDRTLRIWDVAGGTCQQVLTGHARRVSTLVFSPDGRRLASGGFDWAVKLWELASGQCLRTFEDHTSEVKDLAWSPDGRWLASASYDATIRLWDLHQPPAQRVLRGAEASINAVAFTPDGSWLISGSDDQTVRVWDVASGRCVRVIQGYALYFNALAWSPDSQRLLSANSNATLMVWNVADGVALETLHGHAHTVYAAAWSPDGQWLASGGYDQTLRIWNATTGVCLRVIQAHADIIYRIAWSPDGRWLASASRDQTVRVWDAATGACRWVGSAHRDTLNDVAWSPDGRRLATCSEDRTVRVWHAADGTVLQTLVGHTRSVAGVAWSPDGHHVASCGGGGMTGEIFLWDADRGAQVRSFVGHTSLVFRVVWSADGTLLCSGGVTGTIRWWDVATGSCRATRQAHHGLIRALRAAPDGTTLVSAGEDSCIKLWDLQRATPIRTLRAARPYERLDITGLVGLTAAQTASLAALGAVVGLSDQDAASDGSASGGDARGLQMHAVIDSLPLQPTPFVGRSAEVTRLTALLAEPRCRLLTLLGPGGIGKTRLALAVAAARADGFADGVAFVALAAVSTPNQLVFAIGDALRISFVGQADPTAHLVDALRPRHLLLLLDTFEHLVEGAPLIAEILAGAPHVTILVTSRERLNLQAEWLFDVQGLAYPPREALPATLLQPAPPTDYSAVQLFVQRAAQAQPAFIPSDATLAMIVKICQYSAGMPLAIELAAASMRTLDLADIERQIGAQIAALDSPFRDVPARHRSLRAVFDYSWQLLNPDERTLFSRLAVFRGGWTAAAASQVTAAPHAALMRLVDKSLVVQVSAEAWAGAGSTRLDASAEPRFMMLDPIREYALERLAANADAVQIRRRHAHYCMSLAEAAAADWNTPQVEAAVARLHREYDNMRAALQWALDTSDSSLGLELAHLLWRFWRSYSYTSEGRDWLKRLLALDEQPTAPTAIAARRRGLGAAAWLASDQHDFAAATLLFEQSLALRRALGEPEGDADLLINEARQARVAGHYRRATALLEEVLARHRAFSARTTPGSAELKPSSDERGVVLRELGLLLREQGEFARAAALFSETLALHRAIDDRASVAFALLGLADVARDQGDAAGVRTYGEPSLAILRELGIEWAIGFALQTLALGRYYEGDVPGAGALIRESVALFRGLKAEGSLAEVLMTFGLIVRAEGDATAAVTAMSEALAFAWAVGPRVMAASALEGIAGVVITQSRVELATQLLAAAAALRVQMGTPPRPIDHAALVSTLATARATLGNDAFAALWKTAQAMPLDSLLEIVPGAPQRGLLRDQAGR